MSGVRSPLSHWTRSWLDGPLYENVLYAKLRIYASCPLPSSIPLLIKTKLELAEPLHNVSNGCFAFAKTQITVSAGGHHPTNPS